MVIGNICYSLFRCNRNIHSKDYTGDSKATAVTDRVSGYSRKAFSYSTISRSVASLKEKRQERRSRIAFNKAFNRTRETRRVAYLRHVFWNWIMAWVWRGGSVGLLISFRSWLELQKDLVLDEVSFWYTLCKMVYESQASLPNIYE